MLPLHNRDDYREKLRKERQTEYQEYLRQKEGVKHQPQFDSTTVQEKRRQLAEERERELSRQSSRSSNSRRYKNYKSEGTLNTREGKDPYDELRDRKRKEHKRYREFLIDDDYDDDEDDYRKLNLRRIDPMYRLEEERFMEELNNNRGRRRPRMFDNDSLDRKVHFDDIEDYDDVTDRSAMRRYKQTDHHQDTHKRKKDHQSEDKDDEFVSKSHRANSAPLTTKSLMLIGHEESIDSQKRKKQQYAEELRQQMQQKEKEKKLEKLERFGFKIDSKNDHTSQQSVKDSSDKENHVPPQQERLLHNQNPPKLRRHSRDYPPENFYQSRPPLPLDYYDYYRPHPQYYPPPIFPHYYQPDGYDYPLHPPMDQLRRNRVTYDDHYDEQPAQHSRQHPPIELRVTDHDQYKVTDQAEHTDRSPESKAAYRDILRKQIEEKHAKDEKAKLEQERYDKKLRREIQEYDPWGRGGGGAPNQDYHGNIITDLRRMRKDNENNMMSGSPSTSPRAANFVTISDSNTKPEQRPVTEDKGRPQPNQSSQESYKEALQQQIAEKERAKQLEKEKQKIEEEKELLRLEKQRIKLQEEYERELAQQKAKEEEARRKNEAMKREAEEKRMAAIRKREEEELREIKQRPPQKPATPIPAVAPVEFRSDSPPVPALQSKVVGRSQDNQSTQQITIAPPSSPPIPTLRNKMNHQNHLVTDNINSSQQSQHQHVEKRSSHVSGSKATDERVDVLRQLSRMRLEFENEQKKIHRQLSGNSNTSTTSLSNVPVKPRRVARDVFQKKPSAPLPSTSNTQDVSEQFNDLKYRKTSSRLSFMKKYPAPPKSESALDIQQDALLRHQERDLAKLRSDNLTSEHSLNIKKPQGNGMLLSPREQHSRKNLFGDKSLLEESVTSIAQSRPELQKTNSIGERPPSHGGLSLSSIGTLEVENIAARNEERMRRLDAILNSSKADNSDPEAVIRKFLENRDHSVLLPAQKRRASEVSLEADTRMCPVHSHE